MNTENNSLPAKPPFFAVSATKLVVLSLSTFSLYQAYWFYMHWKQIRNREGSDISPLWRTVLAPLFSYDLFKCVREYGRTEPLSISVPVALTVGYVGANILQVFPFPYSLLGLTTVFFLVPAQVTSNRVNALVAPGHPENAKFSAWNWLAVGIGGSLLLLTVIGSLSKFK